MKNPNRLKVEDIVEQSWEINFRAIIIVFLLFTTISCRSQTDQIELIGNENNSIELRITNEREIYIDNKLTSIDSVGNEIVKLTTNFSKSEIEDYIVNLAVDKEVEIGILSDVQQQLREVNARRIKYKTDFE